MPAIEVEPVSYTHLDVYKRQAMYLIKMDSTINGVGIVPERFKKIKIPPTDLRSRLLHSGRVEKSTDLRALNSRTITDIDRLLKNMQQEAVTLQFEVLGDTHINYEQIMLWIKAMRWFEPDEMSATCTEHRPQRYNDEEFSIMLRSSLDSNNFSIHQEETRGDHPFGIVSVEYNTLRTCFYARIDMDVFITNHQEICERFENLFIRFHGVAGFIENNFDAWARSHINSIHDMEKYGFSTVGVEYSYPNSYADENKAINKHCLPWHIDGWNGISFQVCWGMWYGPDCYRIFPQHKMADFRNCADNADLGDGFRRIILYENILYCNAPESRARQWSFRNHLEMCEVIRKLNLGPMPPKEAYVTGRDPVSEFFTEGAPFSHGGDRFAKVYIDHNEKTCLKSKAVGYMYVEYKNNKVIFKEKVLYNDPC